MPAVPRLRPDEAAAIAVRYYGVSGTATRLAAEHDDAFRVASADGSVWLLKAGAVPAEEAARAPGGPSFQAAVLLHLAGAAPALPVQRVVPALDGRPEVDLGGGRLARLTTWLDGDLLSAAPAGPALRREVGTTLARLSRALRGFRHPGAERTHRWDLRHLTALRPLLDDLPASGTLPSMNAAAGGRDGWLRAALSDTLDHFGSAVAPRLTGAGSQVIHADFHGENLLTNGDRVTGILDFGDALTGPVAMDVGIAACYQLGPGPDLLAPALDVVAGYHAADPLTAADLDLAAEFLVARVAARIVVSQWNAQRAPENAAYLLRRTPAAIAHLAALRRLAPGEIAGRLRAACGVEPRPAGQDNARAGNADHDADGDDSDGVGQ